MSENICLKPYIWYLERQTARQLQDFVKARLLPYKYPREIGFARELPKTGTGKIDRQAVMRM